MMVENDIKEAEKEMELLNEQFLQLGNIQLNKFEESSINRFKRVCWFQL